MSDPDVGQKNWDVDGNTSDVGRYSDDEAVQDNEVEGGDEENRSKGRRIDPTKSIKRRAVSHPKLDVQRLRGPKGLQVLEKYFTDFKFHGKGHEKSDLNHLMKKLEYWTHRLFPKYDMDDCLNKLEVLGSKKAVQTYVKKIRLGMVTDDDVIARDVVSDDEKKVDDDQVSVPIDDFDALIAEEIEKHRRTMTPVRPPVAVVPTNVDVPANVLPELTDDLKEKIERNRQLAIGKRLARLEKMEAERRALQEKNDENSTPTPANVSPVTDED